MREVEITVPSLKFNSSLDKKKLVTTSIVKLTDNIWRPATTIDSPATRDLLHWDGIVDQYQREDHNCPPNVPPKLQGNANDALKSLKRTAAS